MKKTKYSLPEHKLFYTVSEIKDTGLMSAERVKLLLYAGKLKGLKNGRNWKIPRDEILRYIEEEMEVKS